MAFSRVETVRNTLYWRQSTEKKPYKEIHSDPSTALISYTEMQDYPYGKDKHEVETSHCSQKRPFRAPHTSSNNQSNTVTLKRPFYMTMSRTDQQYTGSH